MNIYILNIFNLYIRMILFTFILLFLIDIAIKKKADVKQDIYVALIWPYGLPVVIKGLFFDVLYYILGKILGKESE